ncbi:MAG: prolyl oligopeptidase family serine peptidase [Actinobacteria bacterium]|nr:prolyl oligopeptidase family serine peptidase [Actinomycetota bacterium]
MRGRSSSLALVAALGLVAAAPSIIPDEVPDQLPVLSDAVDRGSLVVEELAPAAPSSKTVDGDPSDWVGTSVHIAGTSHYDHGELIHTDYLWDAYGADAGEDIERWNQFAGTFYEERRAERIDDTLRTLEMQLGVPYPIGADEEYGNTNRDLAVGDLRELRVGADADTVHLLIRTTNMSEVDDLGVLLLADTGEGGSPADSALGLPEDHRFDQVLLVGTGVSELADGVVVAADATGWNNALEIAVPADLVSDGHTLDLSVVTGQVGEDGGFTPHNIAFRHAEPIDIYNDRLQAFALHGGAPDGSHVDGFSSGPIALEDLRTGRTQSARPGAGYHERQFPSGDKISTERSKDGRWQPYGLYIPNDFDPEVATPATFWLHYRGGKAHSGATITPRIIHEHAREDQWTNGILKDQGNVVITPHGRGTSYWYVSRSHQDFFEVFEDVHALVPNIDSQRRYLAGYSMGGYGTYLLGLLYPDLFAAGHSVSGAVTQGAWTGLPDGEHCETFSNGSEGICYIEANSGDAAAQLNYRILENARHYPLHIDHGTNDELVPVTGVQRMAARLVELGYRVEMQTFLGYEHFSQALFDEWADGAAYLQRFTAPQNPRHVTYKIVPALVRALNTVRWDGEPFDFDPDGAYWVDDIEVRDPDPDDFSNYGMVDAVSESRPDDHLATPAAPVSATSAGHSSPFVRYGLDWLATEAATANAMNATLINVGEVSFDVTRAGLDFAEPITVTITTDGPSTVWLVGAGADLEGFEDGEVLEDGALRAVVHGDDIVLEIAAAGTWTFAR